MTLSTASEVKQELVMEDEPEDSELEFEIVWLPQPPYPFEVE